LEVSEIGGRRRRDGWLGGSGLPVIERFLFDLLRRIYAGGIERNRMRDTFIGSVSQAEIRNGKSVPRN